MSPLCGWYPGVRLGVYALTLTRLLAISAKAYHPIELSFKPFQNLPSIFFCTTTTEPIVRLILQKIQNSRHSFKALMVRKTGNFASRRFAKRINICFIQGWPHSSVLYTLCTYRRVVCYRKSIRISGIFFGSMRHSFYDRL